MRECTLVPSTPQPITHSNRRIGRPREKWAEVAMRELYVKNCGGTDATYKLDPKAANERLNQLIQARTI